MATAGKASLKRSKPNYIYSIVGVALVLSVMGIMGWLFLNIHQISRVFKEQVPVSAYLRTLNKDTIGQIQQYIATQPYSKDVKYIDKAAAKERWNKENNESWDKTLETNPLPESIDFFPKAEYVNKDSMQKITAELMSVYGSQITEIQYEAGLVSSLDENTTKVGLIFLVVSILMVLIVIVSIDNTIRLAMFSNRFLVKTMQMVGATRGFIAKPMNTRAVVNGLISSLIAVGLIVIIIGWAENLEPELKTIRDTSSNIILFGGMILIGVGISWYSTHRSVLKYLKMKLDELY
jgi:cell division transport system permease protein